ncbi:MAG: hypothetical protein AB1698_01260 [Pseudomonadota bacterium]|jgi:hypothetical protein
MAYQVFVLGGSYNGWKIAISTDAAITLASRTAPTVSEIYESRLFRSPSGRTGRFLVLKGLPPEAAISELNRLFPRSSSWTVA